MCLGCLFVCVFYYCRTYYCSTSCVYHCKPRHRKDSAKNFPDHDTDSRKGPVIDFFAWYFKCTKLLRLENTFFKETILFLPPHGNWCPRIHLVPAFFSQDTQTQSFPCFPGRETPTYQLKGMSFSMVRTRSFLTFLNLRESHFTHKHQASSTPITPVVWRVTRGPARLGLMQHFPGGSGSAGRPNDRLRWAEAWSSGHSDSSDSPASTPCSRRCRQSASPRLR